MDIHEVFDRLKKLQTVLLRKNELEAEILNAPTVLKKHEELLERLKQEYIEQNEAFEASRKAVNELKGELFEESLKRENAEKSMESVETQRDYEILEKAINDARNREDQIRYSLDAENERFQQIDNDIKEREKLIAASTREIDEMKSSLSDETDKMHDELKTLDEQKKAYSKGLDSETIFKFERIVKSKLGNGIVAVKGGVCTGCNMILPAQFANDVQSENELKYCPYCSRVLYYEPAELEVDEFSFDESEIGGLADLDDI